MEPSTKKTALGLDHLIDYRTGEPIVCSSGTDRGRHLRCKNWVLVKESSLSYHNRDYGKYYGSSLLFLKLSPLTGTQKRVWGFLKGTRRGFYNGSIRRSITGHRLGCRVLGAGFRV